MKLLEKGNNEDKIILYQEMYNNLIRRNLLMNLYHINIDINNNYVNYIAYNKNYVVYHIIDDNKKQQFFYCLTIIKVKLRGFF